MYWTKISGCKRENYFLVWKNLLKLVHSRFIWNRFNLRNQLFENFNLKNLGVLHGQSYQSNELKFGIIDYREQIDRNWDYRL